MTRSAETIQADYDEFMKTAMSQPGVAAVVELYEAIESSEAVVEPPQHRLYVAASTSVAPTYRVRR